MKTIHTSRVLRAALACATLPALPLHASTGGEAPLQAIDVVGRRSTDGYHAGEAYGAKTGLPLRELPQAVRILSRQSLDDLGAVRIDDALDYVGGVSRQNNFGGFWDNIAIRGLAGDANNGMALMRNGFSDNRGMNGPRDTANVERIEFLKGAAASLYGASEPGGTLNIVSKQPLWRSAHAFEAYAGSFDFYRTALDSTGPLSENLAYRVNAALERRGSFRDHVSSRRAVLAPSLAWKIGTATRFDYKGEYLRQSAPLDRGLAAIGTDLAPVSRERFLGEPGDGDNRLANQAHQFVLEHALDNGWALRTGLAYKDAKLTGFATEPQPSLRPDQRTLWRQRRYRDYASEDLTVQAELRGRFQTGAVAHELLAGVETYRFDYDQRLLRVNPSEANPYAINVLAPVYGQTQPIPLPNTDTREEQRNTAFYLQDAMQLGASWRLMTGVRLDRYDQSLNNLRTGARFEQSPHAASPRIGISYLPSSQWTVFANAGRSFRPNTGVDAATNPFEAEKGRAAETGIKWEDAARTVGATLALYDIRKRNALTADPGNPGFSIAAGTVRSRGMDFDLSGRIGSSWRLNASLSWIDAEVLHDNTLAVGERLINVPRVNGSLLLMHETANAWGRYGVGAGVTHSGKRLGEARTAAQVRANAAPFELPAYTLARLASWWQLTPRVRLSLDVDNLFNKTYYTSSYQRTWVSPGAPRSVTFGLQTKL